ncbi:hypothetical protein, partial [Escherichia coli]|uniref:hypothetical protein n=1 Tax=Escherichia coli TaxID=562 RepID=UPI00192A3F58
WLAYTNLSLALYVAALLPLLALALLAWRLPATSPVAGASAQRRAPMSRLDARLRLPQLAAFIAMVSVTIAQVTVGFFAIDRLGLDAAAGARMAGIAPARDPPARRQRHGAAIPGMADQPEQRPRRQRHGAGRGPAAAGPARDVAG